ncbi:flagellar hook-associated protein FlgK [Sphingomonas bacterium]|uniref:flagellar hook-associated protein FlgK n=1 Tax=Sphingomonas bacterium TaxID=1895847 RepID=UPI0015764F03|nr:flagellar hook-associated protein FlgK [Sphingomonas bacterium]
MSDLLSIGASGVRAYQTALSTVSENIANSATAGYVRRSTTLNEISGNRSGLTSTAVVTGSGVTVTGVTRSADALKSAAVRSAGADLAKTETGATWLTRIQSAMTGDNLSDRLTGFYTAATTLAGDPSSTTNRAAMLEAAASAAGAFTATGRAVDQIGADLDTTADQATTQLSSLASGLAAVNQGLSRTAGGTSAAANLADQRDSILEQMSALSDVNVTTDALGRATVKMGGPNGATLVSGTDAGDVTYVRNADGAVSFAVHFGGATSAVEPTGGALAGVVDGAQKIKDAQTQLDAIATGFTTSVNTVQTSGSDLNGAPGTAMFATGSAPTEISLALTDPSKIAAASSGGGPRDGSNLDVLQAARTSSGVEVKLTSLVADNAASISQRGIVADAQSSIRDNAVASRDAASQVDLNTEAVDLLRFQQAYSAASRVVQVARDTFQSILDIR